MAPKKTKKKSEFDVMAKVPIYGPMLSLDSWLPETALGKNIIISKIMLVIFTVLAVYAWYFWTFVLILCLHTLEYFPDDPKHTTKHKL